MYRCHYCQEVKPRDAFPAESKKCWRCNDCLTKFLKSKSKQYDAARRARDKARAAIDPAYAEMLRRRKREKEKRRSPEYLSRKRAKDRVRREFVGPPKPKWAYKNSREDAHGKLRCVTCRKMMPRGNFDKIGTRRGVERRCVRCRKCNKPFKAASAHNRRARLVGTFSGRDVERLLVSQQGKCLHCHISFEAVGYHVDHIVPISKGGANTKDNLQLLCPKCNLKKSDKVEGQINRRPRL